MARAEKNKLQRLSRLLNWLMSSPHLEFSTLDSSPASHVLRSKRAFQGSAPWTAHRGSVRCPQWASCQGAVRGAEIPVRRHWPNAEEDPAGSAMFCLLGKYLIGGDVDRRRIPCFLIYSQYVYALCSLSICSRCNVAYFTGENSQCVTKYPFVQIFFLIHSQYLFTFL